MKLTRNFYKEALTKVIRLLKMSNKDYLEIIGFYIHKINLMMIKNLKLINFF